MFARALTAVFIVITAAVPANARTFQKWSYDRLNEKSDIVVIATVESTAGWDDPADMPRFGETVFKGQLTSFKIRGMLKGELAEPELKLVHYVVTANSRPGHGLGGRAYVADFQKVVRDKDGNDTGPPHYLLFLKRRKDGRLEPVSGQVDSACSVMLLMPEGPAHWHRE